VKDSILPLFGDSALRLAARSSILAGTPVLTGASFPHRALLGIGASVKTASTLYAGTPRKRGSPLAFGHGGISTCYP
jgi:hypothetical protein